MNGGTKDKAVRLTCFFHKLINDILAETFAFFSTGTAADAACYRLISHLKNLCLDPLLLQGSGSFLKCCIRTALRLRASIYQKYFHDPFLLFDSYFL